MKFRNVISHDIGVDSDVDRVDSDDSVLRETTLGRVKQRQIEEHPSINNGPNRSRAWNIG